MSIGPVAAIEELRSTLIAQVNAAFDEAISKQSPAQVPAAVTYKSPTPADGQDPSNKNGQNLTPRGVEIIYRVFDEGGGYNRAAKMLGISQGAAKNRKGIWTKLGGLDRVKQVLDFDAA